MDIVSVRLIKDICTYFYMIIKWATSRGIPITTILKFLNFAEILTQSKAHLLDGQKVTTNKEKVTSNKQKVTSKEQKVTSKEEKVKNIEQKVTCC